MAFVLLTIGTFLFMEKFAEREIPTLLLEVGQWMDGKGYIVGRLTVGEWGRDLTLSTKENEKQLHFIYRKVK